MIKIYGQMMSRAPRCLWLLEEAGVPYQHVPVNQQAGEAQKPEFLAINPNGKVPALEDGDVKLFESMAINLYLGRKYGKDLWPASEADQARAIQWSFWGMTEIEPPLITILVQQMFTPDDQKMPDRIEDAKASLPRPLKVLEDHLKNRSYLLGDKFTVADLNLASIFMLVNYVKYDLSPYPNVQKWLGACLGRPALAKLTQS
ncbi:MAG: glutathione S-transferase family protein [Gammaproteobacteria bacterium]|nr:glutathione S-transferase family protein [Gammaproteobacteria bacterium]